MKTKWLTLTMLIGCGGLFAILSFGLTLAYVACNNNIVLFQSVLPEVIDVCRDVFEIFAWSIAFSILVYAIFFRISKRTVFRLVLLFGGLLLLRRIFDLLVTWIMYQALSVEEDLLYNLFYWIIDLAIVLISWKLSSASAKKYYRRRTVKNKAKALFSDSTSIDLATEDFYPFKKIFSKNNPLQTCILKISLLFSASKLLSRLIFDLGYGAPEDMGEVFIMILYYLSDVICGVIFYAFCFLLFHVIFAKHQKAKKLDDVH